MSSNEYQVQNIFRYSRKSYKKNGDSYLDNATNREQVINITGNTPINFVMNEHSNLEAGCSSPDSDTEIANILHKKCPVISLAQQQLLKLIEETDILICENTRTCRTWKEFLALCKEVLLNRRQSNFAVMLMVLVSLVMGILLGAGTCGTYLGQFNSPILSCIDSYFIQDVFPTIEESYRSIA